MASGGGAQGLGGATGDEGFGHVGEAGARYSTMATVLLRAGEVRDNVEAKSINVEKYVKEIAALLADLTKAMENVRGGALEDDQHGVGDQPRRQWRQQVHFERDHGTQCHHEPQDGKRRQVSAQAVASAIFHSTEPSGRGT